jgi:hypothetical protein
MVYRYSTETKEFRGRRCTYGKAPALSPLLTLRERLSEIEEDTEDSFEKRRQLVKLLVAGITAGKDEEGRPDVRITYRFGPPEPAQEEAMVVHGIHSSTRK